MNGIVALDKPAEITSAQAVAGVKRALKADKVGHTGTLDPFATGVLICCVNRATRLAQFLAKGEKSYEAVMRLGVRTDTQDFTGRVVAEASVSGITDNDIRSVFHRFLKVKEQVPPAFSALKHQGKPLYKLARQGIFIEKPPRPIEIYGLEIIDIEMPFVRFEVCCSAGTYVRTLSADLGDALGCGAHLVKLCRTENNGIGLAKTISMSTLEKLASEGHAWSCVLPMNDALKGVPEVRANRGLARKIRHGEPVTKAKLGAINALAGAWIKVTDSNSNLIAVLGSNMENGVLPYMCVFPEAEGRGTC